MNYSTFDIKNFYIKKDSTYPELKYPLVQQVLEQYNITDDMLENVGITFSMIDSDTGLYRIANSAGNLEINNNIENNHSEEKYILTYNFTQLNTKKIGNYLGEFVIDFLDPNYNGLKIKLPVNGYINIIISDSITKTNVI